MMDVNTELAEAQRSLNSGRFEDAEKRCEKILAEFPDDLRALDLLGGSLARAGNLPRAIEVVERLCRLNPGDAVSFSNLSHLYARAGNAQNALLALARAVNVDPQNGSYQRRFARLADHMTFYRLADETAEIRRAIGLCLENPKLDPAPFATSWHSLLLLEPFYGKFAELTGEAGQEDPAETVDFQELEAPLTDPFLLSGLGSLHAVDARLERIMTYFRRVFTRRFGAYDAQRFLPFLCALAEHCILNEHVYWCTDEERALAAGLEKTVEPGDEHGARAAMALACCYGDAPWQGMAGMQDEGAFASLVKLVTAIHRDSGQYREAIPAIAASPGSAPNAVSAAVADQYEENPYPRWRHLDIPQVPEQLSAAGRGKRILVAGCGTGFEPLNLAAHYPQAQVLGVDLSLASLAWGRQKADEFGIGNVEFMQGDILDLENLGQRFDLVTCRGVLHHMEDPVEGWRRLLGCLEPDGFMKVALYSETARQSVVRCRGWIEDQGFGPTPHGIREFRQAIMALDDDDPMKDIMNWTDFWTLSMCRDLVFHVQEQRVTLPWIKSALDELGLVCLSMGIGNPVFRNEYRSKFPGDPEQKDLDRLHEFEMQQPDTFRDMYQFWCCRKGSAASRKPPAWFYTAGM